MNYSLDELKTLLTGGLIPAVPVMFDREHRFHERAHEAYVAFMSSQPIAGIAIWAHTGRGLLLDDATAGRVLQQWRRGTPEKPLLAGVGARSNQSDPDEATRATLSMASAAAGSGADALLVYPPCWLKHHDRRESLIVEHHRRLSDLGLPLVLFYLYEAAGGVSYSPDVLDQLLGLPNVLGIKMATLDSVMTYQDVARQIKSRHTDKLLITGEDRFLGYSIRRGADAALIGLGAVCCDLQSELIEAHFAGNAERFLDLSDIVDQLAEVLFIDPMEGYIGRILCALAKLGVIPAEAANDPWGPALTPHEIDNITNVLNSLNVQVE
ncbi:MAG TPA: dihydrodipicolinate synthase family protein [Pyrinomonadaceae bacterium]|jgi:4-hydroxy-tetrahydrodipicolinate synthase|nr:dihydrodipicolinate synthase family protein [Pyrinomonadaceae bacterium]